MNDKILLTVEQAAERLSLGRARTWQLVMAGVIPSVKIGRSRRVPATALERWALEQAADVTPATQGR